MQINWEVTKQLEQEKKYVKFNQWCKENGVVNSAVRYPVAFGEDGQLVGIAARREIGFNEAYLYVPMKVIICASKVLKSEIGPIIDKYINAFNNKSSTRQNQGQDKSLTANERSITTTQHLIIIFFVLHEMSKGEDSFWHPWFDVSEKPDVTS